MNFPDLGINISLPEIMLFKGQGVLAAMGYILNIVLAILFVVWIGYSIYAGYKIATSSMAKGLEEGMAIIKNIWIGISMGIAFFAVISVIGGIVGIGDVTRWHTNLSQCHDVTGGFYFKDVQEQITLGFSESNYTAYCCKVTNIDNAGDAYNNVSFKDGTYHYILTDGGEPGSGFEQCTKF
jgi:hypothetical protein